MLDFNEALDELSEVPPLDSFVFHALGGGEKSQEKTIPLGEMKKRVGAIEVKKDPGFE